MHDSLFSCSGTLDVLNLRKTDECDARDDMEQHEEEEKKRKRGDRGSRRAKKIKDDEGEEVGARGSSYRVGEDRQYDVWLPPDNQSGGDTCHVLINRPGVAGAVLLTPSLTR